MEIVEYEEVDPLDVLHLNLLCLDFALTPELVAMIRHMDPRPFPFFALYTGVANQVAGQVGVSRLPVVSINGAEEIGGIWGVTTLPTFTRHGISVRLLEEAHTRMRAAGLLFSTLRTNQSCVAYNLYRKLGYEKVGASASALARRDVLPRQSPIWAERANSEQLPLADQFFEKVAKNHLGFARRHIPFFPSLDRAGYLATHNLWLLWHDDELVGYAAASTAQSTLRIANLLLSEGIDPVVAVAALVHEQDAAYVHVRVDHRANLASYLHADFRLAERGWEAFMVKPLTAASTVEQFRTLFRVNSDRFLMSYLDVI